MKKIIGVVLLIVVAALLLGPYYAGLRAEKELQNIIARFDAYPGYQLAWTDYDRGWFTTEATLSVGLDPAFLPQGGDQSAQWPQIPLSISIHHGPLLLNAATLGWYSWQLNLTEDQNAWLEQHITMTGDEQLYQAHGHMGLLGTVEHKDELQPFTVNDDQGAASAHVKGYTGDLTVDASGKLSYAGAIKGLDLTAQDALLVLGNVTLALNGDLSRLDWSTFLYPSDFFMNIASLQVQGGEDLFELTNAVFEGTLEMPEEHDWFNFIMSATAGDIKTPQTRLQNASMTIAYERISLAAYQAYMEMAVAAQSSAGQGVDYQQFFTPEVLQEFFANSPAFVLRNLSFTMPGEGDFKGSLELAMKEGFALPDQLINPMIFVQALALKADAQIDRSLALYLAKESSRRKMDEEMAEGSDAEVESAIEEQAQRLLEMLTAQGLVVEDGEELKAAMRFIDGQLLLNGNPMPLPLGLLMGEQGPQQNAPQP